MNNQREKNREIIKNVLRDYTQQKQDLRNRVGMTNHLGETPSMFVDTQTYIVYLDTRKLLKILVPHNDRPIKDIITDLKDLYDNDDELESKLDVLLSVRELEAGDVDTDELDYEWTPNNTKITYNTDSNKTLFGFYNSLGYDLPNKNITEYKKILSKLNIEDVGEETLEENIEGVPDIWMIKKTIEIYLPILERMTLGKKENYTWNEMIRQHKWQEYPL